jgi:hypothetical protein
MKKLEQEGWFCIRSAGSHSPIDIIAIKPLQEAEDGNPSQILLRFIQSKKSGYLTPKERKEKEELEQHLGIKIQVM